MSDLEKKLRETKELIPEPPKSLDAKLEARLNDSIKPLK